MQTLTRRQGIAAYEFKRLHTQGIGGYGEQNAVERLSRPSGAEEL
jgi:hypothetical protein